MPCSIPPRIRLTQLNAAGIEVLIIGENKKPLLKAVWSGGEGSRTLDKELMSLLLWPLSYPASTLLMIIPFAKTVNQYGEFTQESA